MSLISYSLGKAYSVLGTRICWKSPNLNHFDIKWSENFLKLFNKAITLTSGDSFQFLWWPVFFGGLEEFWALEVFPRGWWMSRRDCSWKRNVLGIKFGGWDWLCKVSPCLLGDATLTTYKIHLHYHHCLHHHHRRHYRFHHDILKKVHRKSMKYLWDWSTLKMNLKVSFAGNVPS